MNANLKILKDNTNFKIIIDFGSEVEAEQI